jgi:hypothetical protein
MGRLISEVYILVIHTVVRFARYLPEFWIYGSGQKLAAFTLHHMFSKKLITQCFMINRGLKSTQNNLNDQPFEHGPLLKHCHYLWFDL